ncbi:hypothetical protein ACLOJK_023000 [Asimina triloba]
MLDLQRMRSPVYPFTMTAAYRGGFGRRCGGGPPDLTARVRDDDPTLLSETLVSTAMGKEMPNVTEEDGFAGEDRKRLSGETSRCSRSRSGINSSFWIR